ncbi:MAG: hypothetical protein KDB80_15065 [Planctomycetes bacterium]|nr:hypothetical protein [Planctomycetota bacterium]
MIHRHTSSSFRRSLGAFAFAICMFATSLSAQLRPTPDQYQGSNYFPSTALGMSNALALLNADNVSFRGAFNLNQTSAEISMLSKMGVNVIRVFPSFYGWLVDSNEYMANLKQFAKLCQRWRIHITYVMWNTTSNVFIPTWLAVDPGFPAYDATLHVALQQTAAAYTLDPNNPPLQTIVSMGEPWQMVLHDEPGNGLFEAPYNGDMNLWPNNLKAKCEAYVDDIGNFFANDPDGRAVYASYDLFNEPDCCFPNINTHLDFIEMTYQRLVAQHNVFRAPVPEFTVGFADNGSTLQFHQQLSARNIKQTYLSFHCYEPLAVFSSIAQANALVGQQLNMPVVCSEFYDRNIPGHLGNLSSMINDLKTNGLGGQVWGVLSTNLVFESPPASANYIRLDGMLIPSAVPSPTSFTDPIFFLLSTGALPDAISVILW